jgi:hypothetical protein
LTGIPIVELFTGLQFYSLIRKLSFPLSRRYCQRYRKFYLGRKMRHASLSRLGAPTPISYQ